MGCPDGKAPQTWPNVGLTTVGPPRVRGRCAPDLEGARHDLVAAEAKVSELHNQIAITNQQLQQVHHAFCEDSAATAYGTPQGHVLWVAGKPNAILEGVDAMQHMCLCGGHAI